MLKQTHSQLPRIRQFFRVVGFVTLFINITALGPSGSLRDMLWPGLGLLLILVSYLMQLFEGEGWETMNYRPL